MTESLLIASCQAFLNDIVKFKNQVPREVELYFPFTKPKIGQLYDSDNIQISSFFVTLFDGRDQTD